MQERIAVIGLGYVGLPLAVALARHFTVTGYDISKERLEELEQGYDRTDEVNAERLKSSSLKYTFNPEDLKDHSIYIIAVPTPVDALHRPDFSALKQASETVGKILRPGAIVVYESTVYPGVTEDICAPILEKISGLRSGLDFYLGYSPERANPGEREHTLEKITKVVAGQTPEVAEKLVRIYGCLNNNNIFVAASIKTAEAAKVIENAQRDINIAFINEVTLIFNKLGLSVHDVLEAAQTKWNFLPFKPGLVGGHCIGVDPYYLAECSKQLGHNPEVILAGRRINDSMGTLIAASINECLKKHLPYGKEGRILILGLTFKENVPDLRNSKVEDIIRHLEKAGHSVIVHDPRANAQKARQYYNVEVKNSFEEIRKIAGATHRGTPEDNKQSTGKDEQGNFDCVIGAVAHDEYLSDPLQYVKGIVRPDGLVADIKGIWRGCKLPEPLHRWEL